MGFKQPVNHTAMHLHVYNSISWNMLIFFPSVFLFQSITVVCPLLWMQDWWSYVFYCHAMLIGRPLHASKILLCHRQRWWILIFILACLLAVSYLEVVLVCCPLTSGRFPINHLHMQIMLPVQLEWQAPRMASCLFNYKVVLPWCTKAAGACLDNHCDYVTDVAWFRCLWQLW